MDQNSTTFVGRLADDPKLHPNADPLKTRVWFRIAVNRGGRKDAQGNQIVDWFPVVVFGPKATAIAEHCHKGKEVSLVGELHEDSKPMTLADGTQLTHPETGKVLYNNYFEILAQKVSFGRDSEKWLNAQAALGNPKAIAILAARSQAYAPQPAVAPAPTAYAPAPAPVAAPVPQAAPAPQVVSPELLASVTQGVMNQLKADQAAAGANPLGEMAQE